MSRPRGRETARKLERSGTGNCSQVYACRLVSSRLMYTVYFIRVVNVNENTGLLVVDESRTVRALAADAPRREMSLPRDRIKNR